MKSWHDRIKEKFEDNLSLRDKFLIQETRRKWYSFVFIDSLCVYYNKEFFSKHSYKAKCVKWEGNLFNKFEYNLTLMMAIGQVTQNRIDLISLKNCSETGTV